MTEILLQQIRKAICNEQEVPPHVKNLMTQLNKKDIPKNRLVALELIVPSYIKFSEAFKQSVDNPKFSQELSLAIEEYMVVLKSATCKVFGHQSDFISSVIPEALHRIFNSICKKFETSFVVSSQKDVIIDCTFDAFNQGRLIFKKKKMDVSISVPATVKFNNEEYNLGIPVVAIEVKTNLDKNMLSGIEQSVESLKNTFPTCLYYNVSELADFAVDKQNYATTKVDEIYILRKQKRSETRGRNPQPIKQIDEEVITEVVKNVIEHLRQLDVPVSTLKARMSEGKLINKRSDTFE
ncbi:hypothetical protein CN391_18210 [Bacillus anthracis]|nr:hypothetical protein CN391_18210 [Bacillus anthracis]